MGLVLLLVCVFASAASPASAQQTHLFLEAFGSAAQPEFGNAAGLSVDHSTGDLLVIENEPPRVSRYHSDGTPSNFSLLGSNVIDATPGMGGKSCAEESSSCDRTPQNGFKFGSFPGESQIAVDESGAVTNGDIYITQTYNSGVHLVDIFSASGKYLGQLTAAGTMAFGAGETGGVHFSPCGVAVDASGSLFVAGGFDRKIYRFDPSANPPINADNSATFKTTSDVCSLAAGSGPTAGSLFADTFFTFQGNSVLKLDGTTGALQYVVDPREDRSIAVSSSTGHLYAVGNDGTVNEYDASGGIAIPLSTFSSSNVEGIAVDGAKIYLASLRAGKIYGPTVTIPDVTTGTVSITGDATASLNGTINPDGVSLDECRFEYGKTAGVYEHTEPCAESTAAIGAGHGPVVVHADLGGLAGEAIYHYRLAAKNPNETVYGVDRTFRTPGKPMITDQLVADVVLTEAIIKAKVNPEQSETTYRFEWGPDVSYGNSTAEIEIGSGLTARLVNLRLNGLIPGATYHWRIVATNHIGISEGPDHIFTTYPAPEAPNDECPNQVFRVGSGAQLPDCRAYEMVSPVDKNNGDILPGGSLVEPEAPSGAFYQATPEGKKITYNAYRAFGNSESAFFSSQYLAARDPESGWSTRAITPPRDAHSLLGESYVDGMFRGFSEDLCESWFLQDSDLVLTSDAVPGYAGLYRRSTCGGEGYEALSTVKPPSVESGKYFTALQGFSADGGAQFFRANGALAANASGEGNYQVYVSLPGGKPRLVSVLPNGQAASTDSSLGTNHTDLGYATSSVFHAISANGSRAYWSAESVSAGDALYLRENPTQPQSGISDGKCTQPERACTVTVAPTGATFWTAAADGSKAIYTVRSAGGLEDLYEFDASNRTSQLIAHEVSGVMGASNDVSKIYFVSAAQLAPGASVDEPNLYFYRDGSFTLVTSLLSSELSRNSNPVSNLPASRNARVSADGMHAVFMTAAAPTGYDNADLASGQPDGEVYLFDATQEGGKLLCISCKPTGAQPAGEEVEGGVNGGVGRWAAAQIPGWQNQFQPTRLLSEDGSRVFFESFDPLVIRDTNGKKDVYEWEAPGSGDCSEERTTFSRANGGCIGLISTGESPKESEFMDASADGSDVFFTTLSSLLPQDSGLVDLYDARLGGGFPPPPKPPAACEGEACQGALAPPDDRTPASSTYEGSGNLQSAVRKKRKQVKRQHKKPSKRHAKKFHRHAGRRH